MCVYGRLELPTRKNEPSNENTKFQIRRGNDGFGQLHGLWAWRHHSTYKSVWKSMNSNCKICIIAHKVIIEHVAPLYSGIVLFRAQGLRGANGDFSLPHGLWAW